MKLMALANVTFMLKLFLFESFECRKFQIKPECTTNAQKSLKKTAFHTSISLHFRALVVRYVRLTALVLLSSQGCRNYLREESIHENMIVLVS